MACILELRGNADADLQEVLREGVRQLVGVLASHDRTLPYFVTREFEAYLGCRDPKQGFAWLECAPCEHHRCVLFSCKTRGFCPSCLGRRMNEKAAHWVDRVIPWAATRQFVLTVPWPRRFLLARRPDLAEGVLQVALRCIARFYRRATGRRAGQSGSVTAIQRFGSALQLNLHFHVLHLDGVYDRGADGSLRFFRVAPRTADVEALVERIGVRCERWLAARGFAGEAEDSNPGDGDDADDALGVMQQASLAQQVATERRPVKKVKRTQVLGGKERPLGPNCASYEGYNLHAGVHLDAMDRAGLERLCRYVLRPPLALPRLERFQGVDGRTMVRIEMKRTYSDGTHAIELSALGLAEKLAAIVPPPRANTVIYGGVLAANAALRPDVIPRAPTSTDAEKAAREARKLKRRDGPQPSLRAQLALSWADLLQRVFRVDGWECPQCKKAMSLRTVVIGVPACTRILHGLQNAAGPPVGDSAA